MTRAVEVDRQELEVDRCQGEYVGAVLHMGHRNPGQRADDQVVPPELLTVADRILVLCEGRLTADFPRAQADEETIMHAATQVLDRVAG